MFRWVKIRKYERGLLYRDRVFREVLRPGRHWIFDPWLKVRVERVSVREPLLDSLDLDVIVRSGELGDEAVVLDLGDRERGLVWVDGRFERIVGPGLSVLWTAFHEVRTEVVTIDEPRFEHEELPAILARQEATGFLEPVDVPAGSVVVMSFDGRPTLPLGPGRYAFWRDAARIELVPVDLRDQAIDVSGQEILTADKVSLRLNALVTFRVADPLVAVTTVESVEASLYRESQLALRAVIGSRELDAVLSEKDAVTRELEDAVSARARAIGLEVRSVGIKDVILPGEMRTILNRVVEAQKAAEADLITRREETAAIRSQANTARVFASNPSLMRLRELEVLEKVADRADLTVILGEGSMTEKVTKLL